MARKLTTCQTSLGFFDLAVAAPSMKAALEAWGADSNLFHQGAAMQSEDPDVIEATMAAPGVVLKRPVGSSGLELRCRLEALGLGPVQLRPQKPSANSCARTGRAASPIGSMLATKCWKGRYVEPWLYRACIRASGKPSDCSDDASAHP